MTCCVAQHESCRRSERGVPDVRSRPAGTTQLISPSIAPGGDDDLAGRTTPCRERTTPCRRSGVELRKGRHSKSRVRQFCERLGMQSFEQLDRYVELELAGSDAAIRGMRAHLEGCSACAEDRESLHTLLVSDAGSDA